MKLRIKKLPHHTPGSYDLSIHNQKFAGISQRRVRGGIAVQIYLCVEGSGAERAEMMKAFYEHALKTKRQNSFIRLSYLKAWLH